MTNDYLNDYAAEHGYTLEVTEQPAGPNRWASTAMLKGEDGLVVLIAASDMLHSERPSVIIPICHTQALRRLEALVRAHAAGAVTKPKRKTARKVVEDGD